MEQKDSKQVKLVRVPPRRGQVKGRIFKAAVDAVIAVNRLNRMTRNKDARKQEGVPNAQLSPTATSA